MDIPIIFNEISKEDYYNPIFVNSSHKSNCKYHQSKGDIEKNYQYTNILARLDRIYMIL